MQIGCGENWARRLTKDASHRYHFWYSSSIQMIGRLYIMYSYTFVGVSGFLELLWIGRADNTPHRIKYNFWHRQSLVLNLSSPLALLGELLSHIVFGSFFSNKVTKVWPPDIQAKLFAQCRQILRDVVVLLRPTHNFSTINIAIHIVRCLWA